MTKVPFKTTSPSPSPSDPQDISGGSGTTDLPDIPTGQAAVEAALEAAMKKAAAAREQETSSAGWVYRTLPGTPEPWIRYETPTVNPSSPGLNTYMVEGKGKQKSVDDYAAEYWKRVQDDPAFEQWIIQRAWAFGADVIDKDGRFNVNQGFTFWGWLGNAVSSNPMIRDTQTPEMYADSRYNTVGGDAKFQEYAKSTGIGVDENANPIKTTTSIYRTKANPEVVNAGVDQLARSLLGRMASEKEMARYRKQINSFLASNPTVSTQTIDSTDPNNVKMSTSTKEGASASEAMSVLEMRMRRGSEGMAFNAGKMIEDAMMRMDRGL